MVTPRPTPPGAIEIKTYPSIRQAEYSGSGDGTGAGRNGFMPLFQHISTNDIAMTAPVEMRYTDTDGDATTDRWTMAFLYHTPENGPVGSDGDVVILDTEPVTVVSIGIQGGASLDSDGGDPLRTLEAWLEASTEWERAGDTRRLGYNGPYVPVRNRWWELQIPIKPTGSAEQAEDAESETI
ncbi:MAG: heme-binding protein [Planctomycetota bacterium]